MLKALLGGSVVVLVAAATASFLAAQQSTSDQAQSNQGTTSGQATDNGQNQAGNQTAGNRGPHVRHDVGHYISDCLIDGNKSEIALARIAQQRATDPQVKQFAERMIQDHTAFLSKLQSAQGAATGSSTGAQSAVGGPGAESSTTGTQTGSQTGTQSGNQAETQGSTQAAKQSGEQGTATAQVDSAGAGAQGMGGARQFVQIKKEVAAQCLQSQTRELNQKEGPQFDRCYMNSQVADHMKMADELTVFGRYGSGDLQSLCQEGLQTTKQHLELAKQIAERLNGGNQGGSASRNQNPAGQ